MTRDIISLGRIRELLAGPGPGRASARGSPLLSEQCVERKFAKNQVVYLAGGPGDSMLVLTSGELTVSQFSADGGELILASVRPGEPISKWACSRTCPVRQR